MIVGNLVKYGGLIVGVFLLAFFMTGKGSIEIPESNQHELFVQERQEKGKTVAKYLSRYAIDPILAGGEERDIVLGAMVSAAKTETEDLLYVTITTKRGQVVAATESKAIGKDYSPPEGAEPLGAKSELIQTLKSATLGDYYDVGVGVMLGETKLGEVHVGIKGVKKPPPPPGASVSRKWILIALAIGVVGVFMISIFSRGAAGSRPGVSIVDTSRINALEGEEQALLKRIADAKRDQLESQEKLNDLKKELGDVSTQVQARQNELAQMSSLGPAGAGEGVESLREEANALETRIEQLKATETGLSSSIQSKKQEQAGLEQKLKQIQSATQTQAAAKQEDAEVAQRIDTKKREELSLTMRIVSKRREEIAISQRLEAKRKEEIELMRRLEELKKGTGQSR